MKFDDFSKQETLKQEELLAQKQEAMERMTRRKSKLDAEKQKSAIIAKEVAMARE